MSPERWQQVKDVFHAALDLPPDERSSYIQEACADPAVRGEVESLLASEAESDGFLDAAESLLPELIQEDPPDANIGRLIGPYRIVREIGEGGMGAVYLAEREGEFRQQAALKLMRSGLQARWVVARFRHERQILAGLEHPNIARLLDGGATEDGRPYFVMEYVEGVPIDVWCSNGELNISARLELFRKVCAAVEFAHRNLVVHRDIKPGNILVGGDGAPKLLDFGIAKLLGPAPQGRTAALTEVGMRLMTPEYASPEQARGLPVTTATDIYSLGVVLYQLLTGKMPYSLESSSPAERENTICEAEPPLPSSAQPNSRSARRLAGDLDNITLKALEKDPRRRYLSVEQFSEDIRRHLEGLPVTARAQTWSYRTEKFVRRNRTPVAAAVLLVLALAGGLAATAWQAHVAGIQRARAERRFNDVRRLAESFLFQFDDQIANLPGSTPARNLLVKQALTLLGSLGQEAPGDISLERELAEAYMRVGQVQGHPAFKNLGDMAGAAASYRHALDLAQDLVRRDPKDIQARSDLARAHRSLGDVLWLGPDLAVVVSHYREAIAQLEAVKADASTELKLRAELAGCYESFGDVLGHSGVPNLGDRKGAREAYEKGLNIYESILHEQPQDSHAQGGAAVLRAKIGDLRADEGDAAGALFSYKEAAPALDSLAAADPLNTALRRKVGWIHGKLARAYEAVGQNEAAQAEYARGIDGDRQAMLADPTNVQAREDYAVALKNRAEREYTAKHLPDALADYRLVADLLRPLANEPGNIAARGRYAYMLMMEGSVLGDLHRLDEAKAVYGDGLLVYKALADRPEATADDFDTYAEGLLEAPVKELLNPAAAVVYAKRAVEATKGGEWTFLDRLALSYSKTGDYANASKFEEQALRLMSPSPDRTAAEKRLIAFRSGVK